MIRFCLALASVSFWPALPPLSWLWVLLVVLFGCGWVKPFRMLLPIGLGLVWGLASGHWLLAHRLPDSWQGVDLVAQGTIVNLPQRLGDRCRFDLSLDQLIAPADIESTSLSPQQLLLPPRRLRLSWYHCQENLQPGQRWQLLVRLKRPHGFVNPSGFDYALYLLSRGIDASGYVRSPPIIISPSDSRRLNPIPINQRLPEVDYTGRLDRWRSDLVERLRLQLTASPKHPVASSLIAALLVGDKRGLDDDIWQTLRDTGTAHLFVISGLHIGMVAGFCYATVFWLGRLRPQFRFRHRQIAASLCAIIGSGIYAVLAGFGLPTQRAWVMVCALMLSLIGWRSMTPSQRLWLAVAAVLIVEPLAVRQAGFWLSFGACAVLVYAFAGGIGRVSPLRQLLWAQVAIVLGLTPWLLQLFSQWPPLAPLVNLIAIPLVTLLLPLLLLDVLMLALWPAVGSWLLIKLGKGFEWGWQGLDWAAQQISAVVVSAPISWWMLLLALLGGLWLLLPPAVPGRWIGTLLWLPLLWPSSSAPPEGGFRVTVLDVGQGLSVLVETRKHRLLYDTGPRYRSGFNAAEAAVVPFLHGQGIRQLDRLIVSHADSDHAGGQAVIERLLQVDQTLTGSQKITADQLCQAGQQWRWDGVSFMFMHPDKPALTGLDTTNENNRSCVLKIDNGLQSVLLTGDIEARVEQQLVNRYGKQLRASTLVAAHHGSRSSTTDVLLQQVDPERVLISSGWRNRFGHPHPAVVQRIKRPNADQRPRILLNTATDGAIRIDIGSDGTTDIATALSSRWGYWRLPLLDRLGG